MMPRRYIGLLFQTFLLTACSSQFLAAAAPFASATPRLPEATHAVVPTEVPTHTLMPTFAPSATLAVVHAPTVTPTPLDPEEWNTWPIIPVVPESIRLIYRYGQSLGNNPNAFSIFGDCQSEPEAFLGAYETEPEVVAALPPELQETVAFFTGSFTRDGPTIRGGTTAGALLWPAWHQNRYGCQVRETPVDCELRVHRPSYVIIHVGTHFEDRNTDYLRRILDRLLELGVIPILVTKADNREQDERVNYSYALLAVEYDLPIVNFWAATQSLPNQGLYTRSDRPAQGDIYLTEEAIEVHRYTVLQALDSIRRTVTGE